MNIKNVLVIKSENMSITNTYELLKAIDHSSSREASVLKCGISIKEVRIFQPEM